jgi:hypothetical protein
MLLCIKLDLLLHIGSNIDIGNMPYSTSSVKLQAFFVALALYIARNMQPLSLVENQHFSDLIRHNDPRLTLPCRGTITHTILPQLYRLSTAFINLILNMIY